MSPSSIVAFATNSNILDPEFIQDVTVKLSATFWLNHNVFAIHNVDGATWSTLPAAPDALNTPVTWPSTAKVALAHHCQ